LDYGIRRVTAQEAGATTAGVVQLADFLVMDSRIGQARRQACAAVPVSIVQKSWDDKALTAKEAFFAKKPGQWVGE
jgi:hypothetical protein